MSDPATGRVRAGAAMPAWQRLGLGVLSGFVPVELIDEVLVDTGAVQQRVRLLPARVVVLFVLALTLFSGYGYRAVWRQLVNGVPGLAGRNFPGWRMWQQAAATGAHLLWRIKPSVHLPRVGTFIDGSWLAVLPTPGSGGRYGTWVRVIDHWVHVSDQHAAPAANCSGWSQR